MTQRTERSFWGLSHQLNSTYWNLSTVVYLEYKSMIYNKISPCSSSKGSNPMRFTKNFVTLLVDYVNESRGISPDFVT